MLFRSDCTSVSSVIVFLSHSLPLADDLHPELTLNDVLELSPKFWELHQDPLPAFDGGAMTLVTIQVNLTAGTIARQTVYRPELVSLVDDLLKYRKQ